MLLGESSIAILQEYLSTRPEERSITRIGGIYWKTLIERITDLIHENQDIMTLLSEESDFINFGLTKELFEDAAEIGASISDFSARPPSISIRFLTSWVVETFAKIHNADKKELLDKDLKRLELERRQLQRETATLRLSRIELLENELADAPDLSLPQLIDFLTKADEHRLLNLQAQKNAAKGVFMSVQERRVLAARTMQHQKETEKLEAVFSRVRSSEGKSSLHSYTAQINELLEKSASCDDLIRAKWEEIAAVETTNQSLSPIEVENRMRTELEYLRDMTRLSARRLHLETCSILKPGDQPFTLKQMCDCFDRIFEFDPELFNNDRVKIFGRPSALIVPGNGNAVYDWKNNQFIIPLVPPGGDFIGSVATGVIEYRIDVDEEKTMMGSYQRLPENKLIRSIVTLRQNLTKDYKKWMTAEYIGFRVLGKRTRDWFERHIAPKKNEIFCPLEYRIFVVGPERMKEMRAAVELHLASKTDPSIREDLWAASILAYQEGKFAAAGDTLEKLLSVAPERAFAWFNLGIIGMKVMDAEAAQKAFREFIARNPRSWWTSVASEHLRRLQENE